MRCAGVHALFYDVARRVKEDDAIFECEQNEDQRYAKRCDAAADQNSTLLLSCHRTCLYPALQLPSLSSRAKSSTRANPT